MLWMRFERHARGNEPDAGAARVSVDSSQPAGPGYFLEACHICGGDVNS